MFKLSKYTRCYILGGNITCIQQYSTSPQQETKKKTQGKKDKNGVKHVHTYSNEKAKGTNKIYAYNIIRFSLYGTY